jgi:hypothetical protein
VAQIGTNRHSVPATADETTRTTPDQTGTPPPMVGPELPLRPDISPPLSSGEEKF